MNTDLKLIRLYGQLASFTADWCARECRARVCCSPDYCNEAKRYAKERWDVKLEGGSGALPFLDKDGHCLVPPHMRPMCTAHVCERAYMGDVAFSKTYFRLRDAIARLEVKHAHNS